MNATAAPPGGSGLDDGQLLTTREIAAGWRVDQRTVTRWIALGRLPATRVGKQYRVTAADLRAFIDSSRLAS